MRWFISEIEARVKALQAKGTEEKDVGASKVGDVRLMFYLTAFTIMTGP